MAKLITVPSVVFEQGDITNQETPSESPIQIQYYNGSICLEQCGNEIIILPDYLDKLFREIKKHQKYADYHLKKK